jgi:hypothetical protein
MRGVLFQTVQIPPTWRRKTLPPCPVCRQPTVHAWHHGCPSPLGRLEAPGRGSTYIDIATGLVHCVLCNTAAPIEDWHSLCSCGAVFEGGEIWEGMAAEIGKVGDLQWARAAGIRRGTLEITFLGWWFCRGCHSERDHETGWLVKGKRAGALCLECHYRAAEALGSWFSGQTGFRTCRWCAKVRRVAVLKRANVCKACNERIYA